MLMWLRICVLSALLLAFGLAGGEDTGGELQPRAPSAIKKPGGGRREVPLAIVATIDGSLVAVKADTGSHIWCPPNPRIPAALPSHPSSDIAIRRGQL